MTAPQHLPDFDELDECISDLVDDTSPSFVHGFFCGMLAGGYSLNKNDYLEPLLEHMVILPDQIGVRLAELLQQLYDATRESLVDIQFSFQLLLPMDDQSLQWRAEGLANWSTGFISGFADTTQLKDKDLNDAVREALADMGAIAELDVTIEDSDDNEQQLMQLEEYLRTATQFIFDSFGQKPNAKTAVAQAVQQGSNTLH